LIELLDRYNGINNGMIGLGVRTLADELRCSHATASRALKELDDAGLARPQTVGVRRGKRATEWRVAFYRCDASGELPNKSWPARFQSHLESGKVSPRKRHDALSFTAKTQMPKNPINENALSLTREAHIDSNHRVADLVTRLSGPGGQGRKEAYPDLPEFLKRRNG
jgi:DNA-binding transcriptional MocR family regulator